MPERAPFHDICCVHSHSHSSWGLSAVCWWRNHNKMHWKINLGTTCQRVFLVLCYAEQLTCRDRLKSQWKDIATYWMKVVHTPFYIHTVTDSWHYLHQISSVHCSTVNHSPTASFSRKNIQLLGSCTYLGKWLRQEPITKAWICSSCHSYY